MSQLLTIYQTIAGEAIPVASSALGSIEVPCLPLDSTPQTLESAVLPCRILQPFNAKGEGSMEGRYTPGPGGVFVLDWGIADMCFWRAAGAGIGLADVSGDLVRYLAAYPAAILGQLRTPKYQITGWVITVDTFEWPAESGRHYHGAISRLTVREITP